MAIHCLLLSTTLTYKCSPSKLKVNPRAEDQGKVLKGESLQVRDWWQADIQMDDMKLMITLPHN